MRCLLLLGAPLALAGALAPAQQRRRLVVSDDGDGLERRWREVGGGGGAATRLSRKLRSAASATFVPSGVVAAEYAAYQRWHVAQDVTTQLRSTLATSVVFSGLGVGSEAATAAAATLAWLARDAAGMVASLAAASAVAQHLNGDARRWRFAADVAIDVALLLEVATPHLPRSLFVPLLCAASVFKALCGVLSGGANAAINAHWAATSEDFAQVTAKGGAISTASGIVGLALSFAFAGALRSQKSTKVAMGIFGLLTLGHLAACAAGLRLLAFDSVGCTRRLFLLHDAYVSSHHVPPPAALARLDRVCRTPLAADVKVRAAPRAVLRAARRAPEHFAAMLAALAIERHVVSATANSAVLAMRPGATASDERRAALHALRLTRLLASDRGRSAADYATAVVASLPSQEDCCAFEAALADAGYDVQANLFPPDVPHLEFAQPRIHPAAERPHLKFAPMRSAPSEPA